MAVTLLLTVTGTLLAVFVADLIAHMVRDGTLPNRAELKHLLYVSFGSLAVLVIPLGILGLSTLDIVSVGSALRLISLSLVAALLVVTLLAVRRLRVRRGHQLLALACMGALGAAVIGLELSIH